MKMTRTISMAALLAVVLGLCVTQSAPQAAQANAAKKPRFFELRVYTTNEGKLKALNNRFRNHTNKIFKKHGMELVGYWTPTGKTRKDNTLVYILAYPSRKAREKAWKGFRSDPEWKKAYKESIADGRIVKKVVSQFLTPTDYSPIK
jgi:hypothetical protein